MQVMYPKAKYFDITILFSSQSWSQSYLLWSWGYVNFSDNCMSKPIIV